MSEDALVERIRSPGYTPRAREFTELVNLLAGADEVAARDAERALARGGTSAVTVALARFSEASGALRPRLVDVVARVASEKPLPELLSWITECVKDPDERARRRAIIAAGKLGITAAEGVLSTLFTASKQPAEQKAVAMALSKIGAEVARAALEQARPADPELSRVVREALLLLDRRRVRSSASSIRGDARFPEPVRVLLHVRAGLEELLMGELGPRAEARVKGRGRVEVASRASLSELYASRIFLHLGFPLAPEVVVAGDVVSAAARAIAGAGAFGILHALTEGPLRYRMDWADAGRSRSRTIRVAEKVVATRPGLINDATDAPWEAVITVRSGPGGERVFVELWPRAFEDPRFLYRKRAVQGSSHPTIAAALARVAGVVGHDVVWDPFVGAGLELVERARLGPYRALIGTDLDKDALAAAAENLTAAGISGHRLAVGDAATHGPDAHPTLIITNPPYGRRVLTREGIPPLLGRFLENAARRLAPGGRLVWVSPVPEETARIAKGLGFRVQERLPVDLAGPAGEIQKFEKKR